MANTLIYLDPDSPLNLQNQIRQKLVDGILPGVAGLRAGRDDLYYNNGFWAFDAGPSLNCEAPVWVPFMSGVSGITVAMFPNGVVYYYFSDSYLFRWQTGREAAHAIRPLCPWEQASARDRYQPHTIRGSRTAPTGAATTHEAMTPL